MRKPFQVSAFPFMHSDSLTVYKLLTLKIHILFCIITREHRTKLNRFSKNNVV